MRAFIALRQLIISPPIAKVAELQTQFNELRAYIEEVLTDYNDINENTRMQIDLINESLAELQADKTIRNIPRKRIGYISEE